MSDDDTNFYAWTQAQAAAIRAKGEAWNTSPLAGWVRR
jgi:hypothetical protein